MIYISTIIGTGHKNDNWLKHLIRLCHDGMKYITKLKSRIVGVNYSVGFYPRETHIWLAGAEIYKDIHSPLRNTQHRFTVSQVCWILIAEGHK